MVSFLFLFRMVTSLQGLWLLHSFQEFDFFLLLHFFKGATKKPHYMRNPDWKYNAKGAGGTWKPDELKAFEKRLEKKKRNKGLQRK